MDYNFKNILYPEKALMSFKEQLLSLYQKDYGKRFYSDLSKKLNDTIFVTDALPEDTRKFMLKHRKNIPKIYYLRMELEYYDYQRRKEKINKRLKKQFKRITASKVLLEEELDLLWDSYESKSDNEITSCFNKSIVEIRNELQNQCKVQLLKTTIWGKRMIRKYSSLNIEELIECLYERTLPASTGVFIRENNQVQVICHLPIMREHENVSIDRMILHELRHVVETYENRSGLHVFKDDKYQLLNEIRTEWNALRDEKRLPLMFGRVNKKIQSYYDLFVRDMKNFDVYASFLNHIAYQGLMANFEEELEKLCQEVQDKKEVYKIKKV